MRYPSALAPALAAAALTLALAHNAQPLARADARLIGRDAPRALSAGHGSSIIINPDTRRGPDRPTARDDQPARNNRAKLVLPGPDPRRAAAHTWIDPDRRLNFGNRGLAANHSIVLAQRLARHARDGGAKLIRPNPDARRLRRGHARQSHARLIVRPARPVLEHADHRPRPAMILHIPRTPDARPDDRDARPGPAPRDRRNPRRPAPDNNPRLQLAHASPAHAD